MPHPIDPKDPSHEIAKLLINKGRYNRALYALMIERSPKAAIGLAASLLSVVSATVTAVATLVVHFAH